MKFPGSLSTLALLGLGTIVANAATTKNPNIIFILTDDQDLHMDSLSYMGGVQHYLINQGATYNRHYCTVALCCPSRVNLWTGRAAHNTNVTGLSPPYGGYDKFVQNGFNQDWLFPWMQEAGYDTYFIGKLMNSYSKKNYNKPFPNGFNGTDFLCGPNTYNYFTPTYQKNKDPPRSVNNYTTLALWDSAHAYLEDAKQSSRPFFMVMAPVSPHDGFGKKPAGYIGGGPIPQEQYVNAFPDAKVPRTQNFNPSTPSGTDWLLDLTQLNSTQVAMNDEYYRNRLRALQSVDNVVNQTFTYLQNNNLLDNTYVIYSTDNGFHISQHRLLPGKNCPYEEDVNIPMIIRGPGIKAGSEVNVATSHTDMAATILTMANAKIPDYLDGSAVPQIAAQPLTENFEHASIEHWGDASQDEVAVIPASKNSTYKALRIMGNGYNFYYSVWCHENQHELYDMSSDPYQMNNLYKPYTYQPNQPQPSGSYPINRLESRLDALMLVLKSCKADTCTQPWKALHPDGTVSNLNDAMNPEYDQFYEKEQNRVSFNYCDPGYIIAAEGPQAYKTYN